MKSEISETVIYGAANGKEANSSVSCVGHTVLPRFTFRPRAKVQQGGVCSSIRNEAGVSGAQLLSVQALHAMQYLITSDNGINKKDRK